MLLLFEENTNKMAITTSLRVQANNLEKIYIPEENKRLNRITQQKSLRVSEPHIDRSS